MWSVDDLSVVWLGWLVSLSWLVGGNGRQLGSGQLQPLKGQLAHGGCNYDALDGRGCVVWEWLHSASD